VKIQVNKIYCVGVKEVYTIKINFGPHLNVVKTLKTKSHNCKLHCSVSRVGNLLAAIKACIMEISIGLSDAPFVGPNDRAPNPKIHWVRAAMSPNDQREQHL